MELEINQEFQELIPALSKPEQDALTASLSTEGCRQPITVWKGKNIIVDGHNRYGICTMFNIPFATEEIEFEDENEVKIWMINNQFARRNLSIEHLAELACTLAKVEHKLAEKRMLAGKKIEKITLASPEARVQTKGKSLEKVAKKSGISRSTLERYDAIQRKGTDQQKEAVRSGQKKIGTVYKEIQSKENPQSNESDIEKLLKGKTIQTPYLLLYSKWDENNNYEKQAERSNCNKSEKLQMCTDCIVEIVYGICNQDELSQFRNLVQKFASKVMQKEADGEAV